MSKSTWDSMKWIKFDFYSHVNSNRQTQTFQSGKIYFLQQHGVVSGIPGKTKCTDSAFLIWNLFFISITLQKSPTNPFSKFSVMWCHVNKILHVNQLDTYTTTNIHPSMFTLWNTHTNHLEFIPALFARPQLYECVQISYLQNCSLNMGGFVQSCKYSKKSIRLCGLHIVVHELWLYKQLAHTNVNRVDY